MKNYIFLFCSIVSFCLISCDKDSITTIVQADTEIQIQKTNFEYFKYNSYKPTFTFPHLLVDSRLPGGSKELHLPFPQNEKNPFPIDAAVNLGRVLFYDKNLSLNGSVSCGSCHQQEKAFTDGKSLSVGFNNAITERASMSLQNMAFINNYQWGSASDNLPDLVTKPLLHPVEMGNPNMEYVINKIQQLSYYTPLHENAFGNADIQEKSIVWALSQFVSSIYSSNSKYDQAQRNGFNSFTSDEKLGMDLFHGKALCSTCHTAPTFAAPDFEGGKYGAIEVINELNKKVVENKKGLANNGLKPLVDHQIKAIKIPTLRNIEYSGPYMHDGSLATLDDVIEQYNEKIKYTTDLDDVFVDKSVAYGKAIKLGLTLEEKKALKSFLLSLSDQEFLTAKRYSDPFK